MANHAEALLTDTELREYMTRNGGQTALNFHYDRIIPRLEACMERLLVSKNQKETTQKQPER